MVDHEIAYLTMNYGPEDVVKMSARATKQIPRSQGGATKPRSHPPSQKRVARRPLYIWYNCLHILASVKKQWMDQMTKSVIFGPNSDFGGPIRVRDCPKLFWENSSCIPRAPKGVKQVARAWSPFVRESQWGEGKK